MDGINEYSNFLGRSVVGCQIGKYTH